MKRTMSMKVILAVAIALLALNGGCKKDDGGTGPGGGSSDFITIVTPIGTFTIPTLGLTNLKGLLLTTPEQGQPSAAAFFFGSSPSQLVYAGAVTVNSNTVDTISAMSQVIYFKQGLIGVNFDGSLHSWNVSGGSGIPAFSGSVASPLGTPTITSPADSATVSRSSPLTIIWSGSGTDSVLISVSDFQDHELVKVVSGTSYTFPASEVGTLSAGQAFINVNRVRFSLVSAGEGSYVIASATNDEVTINLN